MQNFTNIGFQEIIAHQLDRKQLALLVTLDFYARTNKSVLKKQICYHSSITPESFSRSIKRLNEYGLIGQFIYNERTKRVSSSFKLNQTKSLYVQVPTHLLRVGAFTNKSLAVFGYLKAMPSGKWDGSVYKLHKKMNHWFMKHQINFSISLTSVYEAIKLLQALKLIDKEQNASFKNKKWIWLIKINVNQKAQEKTIEVEKIVEILQKLTIKPFNNAVAAIKQQEFWRLFD